LIRAITEAKTMTHAGDVGLELRDLVRHARDLHNLLLKQVIAAKLDAAKDALEVCDAMGYRLGRLEALPDDGSRPSTVH
jgi:hypothetical protein